VKIDPDTHRGMHSVLALKLGVTVRFHHPSVVTLSGNGRWELATTWDHYHFALDGDYGTDQGIVSYNFWVIIFSMHDFFFITLVC
jgi:hypothetical protein